MKRPCHKSEVDSASCFEGARANFKGFGDSSLDIEIFGYIDRADYTEFLGLQEKLLLEIMRRVEAAGAQFAVPTRLVQIDVRPETEKQADPIA